MSIARGLKNRGVAISVLFVSEKRKRNLVEGIELQSFRKSVLPNFSLSLLRFILTDNADRYVFVGPGFVSILFPWLRHKKIFLIPQWHHSYITRNVFTRFLFYLNRFFLDYALVKKVQPTVICYTAEERSFLSKFVKNIEVVHLGLDFSRAVWRFFENSPVQEKSRNFARLLFVGRVVDHKFPLFMLGVLKLFRERFPGSFVLQVVGPVDPMYFKKLQKKLKNASLDDQVTFVGSVSEEVLASYYKNADVFVFPSFSESFGYSILEALYAGLPIVSTRTGIVPYLEKQGLVSGVDYGDAEDMANKIFDSVRNSDVTKRKLFERRTFLKKEFDIENFLDSLLNIVN